jgi:hypothetical protein
VVEVALLIGISIKGIDADKNGPFASEQVLGDPARRPALERAYLEEAQSGPPGQ